MGSRVLQLAVLALLSAILAAVTFLGVRSTPLTLYAFCVATLIAWLALLIVGVGGAWLFASRESGSRA